MSSLAANLLALRSGKGVSSQSAVRLGTSLPDVDEALDGQKSSQSKAKVDKAPSPPNSSSGTSDPISPSVCPWKVDTLMTKCFAKVLEFDRQMARGTLLH